MASPVPLLLVLLLGLVPLHLQMQLGPSCCVKGLPPVLHSCVVTLSPTGTQSRMERGMTCPWPAWKAAPPFRWGKEAVGPSKYLQSCFH